MIYSSLAVLALSASAVINPFSNLVHMHPRPAQPDTRIELTLQNQTSTFRDVKIDGHVYTVLSHTSLQIKAPVGTVVYADSRTPSFKRGEAILEVNDKLNHQKVNLN